MFKRFLFVVFLLAFARGAWAQSTTVSGQVTDAGSQAWTNGTITAQFVPNPLFPTFPQYSWTGGTLNQVITGTLSGTGSYSISIPSSTAITPVGSTWQIKFCPQASSGCFITPNTSITGGTQTVNATPPAISVIPGPGASAYSDSEIAGALIGSTYYNTTSNAQRVCNGPTLPCIWGAASTGGASDPNSVYPINFGAKFNGKMFTSTANTCSWTSGQATFTCTGANFVNAVSPIGDIGKQITATINSAGGVGAQYAGTLAFANVATTIISVQSSTQATISQNFTANSGANWIIAWATNDDAALAAAEVVWSSANKCGNLQLPTGITAVLTSHFTSPGPNCLAIEPQADFTAEVQGTGMGSTIVGLFPGFNFASCTAGVASNACFGGYKEATWQNFQFNGFGWGNTGAGSAKILIETGLGSQLEQFGCNAFGGSDANLIGISHDIGTRVWGMSIDGCGKVGCQVNGTIVKYYYSFCGDNLGANLQIQTTSDLTDYGSDYGGSGGTQILLFNGNNARYHGIGSNLFACGITNSTAIFMGNPANNTLILEGGRWNCSSTTSNGLFVNAATDNVFISAGTVIGGTSNAINLQGGNVSVSNSTLTSAGAAIGVGAANSKFVDLCGNTYVGTIVTTPANLLLTPCLTATYPTAIPQVTTTGSTGACATITTQTGNIFNGKLTCTAATAASTIVLTPGITAQNGWNCKNSQDITTVANTFTQTGVSTTTCTLTAASITQNDVIEFSLQQF